MQRVFSAQFLHAREALRPDGIVALVVNALVFVQPVVRGGEGRMHRLEAQVGEERLAVGLMLLVALDDEIGVGFRGKVVVRQLVEFLAVEGEGQLRVGGVRIGHVAPVAAAALQQCEIPLEAHRRRPLGRIVAHMGFSRPVGVIARLAQQLRHRHDAAVQIALVAGLPLLFRPGEFIHVPETRHMVVAAGEQHGSRGRAGRGDVEIRRADAALGERVDVRRLDFTAEAGDVGVAHVIGDDEQDVGFGYHPFRRRCE